MKNTRFVIQSSLLTIILLLPFCGFVLLKYHGLNDFIEAEDSVESEEVRTCKSLIQFGEFKRTIDGNDCYAFYCAKTGECAIVMGTKTDLDRLEYAQTPFVLTQTTVLFQALQDEVAEKDEVIKKEAEIEDAATKTANEQELKNSHFIERYALYLTGIDYGYALWQWAAIFSISVSFCAFGFITSLLTRDGRRFPQPDRRNVVMLALFSCVTGILIVALFAGGLLQGTLFPNFSGDIYNFGFNSWNALKFRGQDWFKLALWAYISGFYERFLPDMLTDLIQKQTGNEEKATD